MFLSKLFTFVLNDFHFSYTIKHWLKKHKLSQIPKWRCTEKGLTKKNKQTNKTINFSWTVVDVMPQTVSCPVLPGYTVMLNETYAFDCVHRMHVCIMGNVAHHLEPVLWVMWRHNPITRSVVRISTSVPFRALKLHSCH